MLDYKCLASKWKLRGLLVRVSIYDVTVDGNRLFDRTNEHYNTIGNQIALHKTTDNIVLRIQMTKLQKKIKSM